ncbi:MAG: hypothetical protein AMXMBFR33_31960 [Candidatus Xenobia bacterium]
MSRERPADGQATETGPPPDVPVRESGSSSVRTATTPRLTSARIRLITAGVITTNFLVALEATVVSTAAPTIVGELGGMGLYAWVFTAYMLTTTVTGPLWGKLSDLYGRKPMYLASVAIFLAGSALSGQSRSMTELIAFRALQGIGGGALIPLGQTVLAEVYDLASRARIQALITTIFGIASIVGPLVGGIITQHASWRWIFYLNVPFGLAGVLILALTLPPHRARGPVHFDWAGTGVFSRALTRFLVWTQGLPGWSLHDPRAWGGLLAIVILAACFWKIEQAHPDPLLPPGLFRIRMFMAGSVVMTLVGMTLFGAITYLPLFYQSVLHDSASQAGQALTPLLVTWIMGSTLSTRMILKAGYRITLAVGLLGFLAAFAIMAAAGAETPRWVLAAAGVFAGVGGGFTVAPLVIAVQSVVDRPHLGIATSEVLFFRSVGASVGVTLMGVALNAASRSDLALGLQRAFQVGMFFAVLSVAAWWLVPPGSAESFQAKEPGQ